MIQKHINFSLQYLFICTAFSLFNLQSLLLNDFKLFSKIYHRVPERKHEKDASCWKVSMNNKQEVVFLKATRTLAVIIKRLKLRRNTVNKKAYSSKKKKKRRNKNGNYLINSCLRIDGHIVLLRETSWSWWLSTINFLFLLKIRIK